MTLSFKQKWPKRMGKLAGKPNYFITKIWRSLLRFDWSYDLIEQYANYHIDKFGSPWDLSREYVFPAKKHTIRADKHNRWKVGNKIHFVVNNRTKDRFQFAPIIKCTGTQKIQIIKSVEFARIRFLHQLQNLIKILKV